MGGESRTYGVTTFAALEARIDDAAHVSAQQRAAIRADGNVFVLARPGSGKTRTVGIRAARLASLQSRMRVATTSYTNVAVRQINTTIREWGVVLGPEHFTGTLHEFLLRYVLYPFGHLAPVSLKQPFHLIGEDKWSGWPMVIYQKNPKKRLPICELHYVADGTFNVYANPKKKLGLTREEAATGEVKQVRMQKEVARKRGLLSFSDAMFYAMKVLESHPTLCGQIAGRFDELIVDEFQDTSDVQMRCIELIHASGKLKSLVLVGDLDQSIYSFQGANPARCRSLAEQCALSELPLTENYRSSQAICDVTCRFCGRAKPDLAVGKNALFGLKPELLVYKANAPQTAVENFRSRLNAHGIDVRRSVVLARGNRFRDQINGRDDGEGLRPVPLALARFVATYRLLRIVDSHELRIVEGALVDMAWGDDPRLMDEIAALEVRKVAVLLLETLPLFDGTVGEWVDGARTAVKLAIKLIADPPRREPHHLIRRKGTSQDAEKSSDILAARPASLWARTVHDVKGESHDAAILVVEPARRRKKGKRDQTELWAAPLRGDEVKGAEAEELRIAYVALTRAERYCAIAIPDTVDEVALQPYLAVGFTRAG